MKVEEIKNNDTRTTKVRWLVVSIDEERVYEVYSENVCTFVRKWGRESE